MQGMFVYGHVKGWNSAVNICAPRLKINAEAVRQGVTFDLIHLQLFHDIDLPQFAPQVNAPAMVRWAHQSQSVDIVVHLQIAHPP